MTSVTTASMPSLPTTAAAGRSRARPAPAAEHDLFALDSEAPTRSTLCSVRPLQGSARRRSSRRCCRRWCRRSRGLGQARNDRPWCHRLADGEGLRTGCTTAVQPSRNRSRDAVEARQKLMAVLEHTSHLLWSRAAPTTSGRWRYAVRPSHVGRRDVSRCHSSIFGRGVGARASQNLCLPVGTGWRVIDRVGAGSAVGVK